MFVIKKATEGALVAFFQLLGFMTQPEIALMASACTWLALNKCLLFLNLTRLDSMLSSSFFNKCATNIANINTLSVSGAMQLTYKANMIGALVSFLVNEIWLIIQFTRHWKTNGEKGIDKREFAQKTATNIFATGAGFAGSIMGAAVGTAIQPGAGTTIGGLIGGVFCSICASLGSDGLWKRLNEKEALELERLLRATAQQEECSTLSNVN